MADVAANLAGDQRPLIVHVVYRFSVGGLENGVVNLINRLPSERWRHVVIALTEVDPVFARRLHRADVRCLALHKPPGQGIWMAPQLWRLFRELRPAIVHTRNLAALETQLPAWLAGVPARLHSEHGRDMEDLHGTNRRHVWMRRAYRPFVHQYIALSRDLADYLTDVVAVPRPHVAQICNGVDIERFRPDPAARVALAGFPFADPSLFVVGTVGRMQAVKAQTLLAAAFVRALEIEPGLRQRLRLVMVGDGPLRAQALSTLDAAGAGGLAWLPGERADVPDVMRSLDCFVLPSLAEGISNTILEAMSTGLPVLATAVGGNGDLIDAGLTGELVPAGDIEALARGLVGMAMDRQRALAQGQAGRVRVERQFSLPGMVNAYQALYERLSGPRATH